MATSATEQLDVVMHSTLAVQSEVYATMLGTLPLVADMKWTNGAQQVSFIWDWQATRKGSYQPNGADTSISRYIIDFDTMHQRNIDNDTTRKVKAICVFR